MGKLNSKRTHSDTPGSNRLSTSFSLPPNFKGSCPGEAAGGDATEINGLPAGPSLNPGTVLHSVCILFAVT